METIKQESGEYSERIAHFKESLVRIEKYYKNDDPQNLTMGYFAEATRRSANQPFLNRLINGMYDHHPDLRPAYAYNKLSRSFQEDALRHYPGYPEGFCSRETWAELFEAVEADTDRQAVIWHNAVERNVQSNVAERYKTVHLLRILLNDRFDHPPHHLDVGSSVLHGDLKLVYSNMFDDLRFGNIEVMTDGPEGLAPNLLLSQLASTTLSQKGEYGAMVGVDITDIDDEQTRHWIKACSFYPDELRNDLRVDEYDLLDHIDRDHERVNFFKGDFSSNRDIRKLRDISPVKHYDIITFSTLFYQLSKSQQTSMIVNALNLLSPDGIIIIQDAPDGNFAKKYNYTTSVIDGTDPRLDEHQILRWENGRCRRVKIEAGRLGALGMRLTFGELLEKHTS